MLIPASEMIPMTVKILLILRSGLENSKFLLIGNGELKNEFFKRCFWNLRFS